jgi:hypothetical protein
MKKLLLCAALIAASFTSSAQVGIGTVTPDNSAVLDLESTTKGFLLPRMTLVQINAIATPAEGLMVYCLDCSTKGLFINNGSEFINTVNGESVKADAIATLVAAASNPAAGDTPSIANLTEVGIINLTSGQTAYEEAIAVADPVPTTLAALQTIIDVVNNPPAVIGDFRDGGIVFWVDPADATHGLVCAIKDQSSSIHWYSESITTEATDKTIGAGSANTDLIITAVAQVSEETAYAAYLARAYRGGDFDDWFLPSYDELNEMQKNKATINSTAEANSGSVFSNDGYWSSSEASSIHAWVIFFDPPGDAAVPKTETRFVRAVRAF